MTGNPYAKCYRYIDNPEATKKAFDADGYFKTGDLARRQDDEYILEGRTSECKYEIKDFEKRWLTELSRALLWSQSPDPRCRSRRVETSLCR